MTSSTKVRNVRRNQKGSVFAELAVGCIIMIAISLFALDIGSAMACFGVNDRACRDAARAAAQGNTTTEGTAIAKSIVRSFANNSPLMSSPQVVSVNYTTFNGQPPVGTSPYVTVTTRATAKPIAPVTLFGNQIFGQFPITKSYSFPLVKTQN